MLTNNTKTFTILFECLLLQSLKPKHFQIQNKPRCHPVWITQQAGKAYAQDISEAGVAHITFVKKEKETKQIFSYLKKSIKIVMKNSEHCWVSYTYEV